eukprot:6303355-Alexandrium_andersonii.AAC.1
MAIAVANSDAVAIGVKKRPKRSHTGKERRARQVVLHLSAETSPYAHTRHLCRCSQEPEFEPELELAVINMME